MMHMTFYWGKNVTLLFDFWKTESWTTYSLTLFFCFLCSAFYQYMEHQRLRFKLAGGRNKGNDITAPLVGGGGGRNPARLAGAVMFGVNSAVGYLLMLAVMSFNAGVFAAVVVGLAVGYLVFRSGAGDGDFLVVDNPCACA